MKRVCVLPGAQWQVPIVKKIKQLGHEVYVINPDVNSPTFEFADGHLLSDIFDKEKCEEYFSNMNFDAILSEECDIAMPLIAKYCRKYGLASISEKSAELFTNKFLMREFCKRNGFLYPEYKLCYTEKDIVEFMDLIDSKVIIKPLDSNSSRGVFIINNKSEINKLFSKALSYSKVEKAIIAERYIEGVEFTIDGIKTPEKHYSLAVSEKKHYKHNVNIASELYFSHHNELFDYDELRQTNDEIIDLTGLEYGLTHVEYKYEDGKYYLIEMAARGGGNLISSHIVPYLSGIDNYNYLIESSFGSITSPKFEIKEENKQYCAVLKFFDTTGLKGTITNIEGEDYLREKEEIIEYKFNYGVGDQLLSIDDDATRAGFYIACSKNKSNLDKIIKEVEEKVRIICREDN